MAQTKFVLPVFDYTSGDGSKWSGTIMPATPGLIIAFDGTLANGEVFVGPRFTFDGEGCIVNIAPHGLDVNAEPSTLTAMAKFAKKLAGQCRFEGARRFVMADELEGVVKLCEIVLPN